MPEVQTKGGIMIPEKAQGKVQQATVVAIGKGTVTEVHHAFVSLIFNVIHNVMCLQAHQSISFEVCK